MVLGFIWAGFASSFLQDPVVYCLSSRVTQVLGFWHQGFGMVIVGAARSSKAISGGYDSLISYGRNGSVRSGVMTVKMYC